MKMEFFAHSENTKGEKHKLSDHLHRTAELARSFAPSKDLENSLYLAGFLHDVGKKEDEFAILTSRIIRRIL